MIDKENMIKLVKASEVKSVADTAFYDHNEISVAYTINSAANCGEYDCIYQNYIEPELITKLKDLGYTIVENTLSASKQYIISWK